MKCFYGCKVGFKDYDTKINKLTEQFEIKWTIEFVNALP